MTTALTLPDGFTAKALDAAASALDAVAAGLPFQVDDLIAGAMALEWMTTNTTQAAQTYDLLHRVRVLVNGRGFARTTEGRAEAGRLVSMVRALRAEH